MNDGLESVANNPADPDSGDSPSPISERAAGLGITQNNTGVPHESDRATELGVDEQ